MQSLFCLCRKTHAEDWPSAPGLHVLGLHVAEDASDWKQRQVSRVEQQVSWVFQVYRRSSFTQRWICPIQPFFTAWYQLHSTKKKKKNTTRLHAMSHHWHVVLWVSCHVWWSYEHARVDSRQWWITQQSVHWAATPPPPPPPALGVYRKCLWTYMQLSNMATSYEQEQY